MNIRANVSRNVQHHSAPPCSTEFIKYFEGYTYDEIALQLGVPVHMVKTRIKETQKILKAQLNNYCSSYKQA